MQETTCDVGCFSPLSCLFFNIGKFYMYLVNMLSSERKVYVQSVRRKSLGYPVIRNYNMRSRIFLRGGLSSQGKFDENFTIMMIAEINNLGNLEGFPSPGSAHEALI